MFLLGDLPVTAVGWVSNGAGTEGTSLLAEMIWVASAEAPGGTDKEKMKVEWTGGGEGPKGLTQTHPELRICPSVEHGVCGRTG